MTPLLYLAIGFFGSAPVVGVALWAVGRGVRDVLKTAVLR